MLYGGHGEINFAEPEYDWTYDNLTGEDYDKKRSKPAPYIKTAIQIAKLLDMQTVVEIGSTRFAITQPCIDYFDNSNTDPYTSPPCCCDGHAAYFWTRAGFTTHTVDIDTNCLNGVKWSYSNLNKQTPENLKIHIPKDCISFLENFADKIDVLYLDGWDKLTPHYAEKHLEAYIVAKQKLSHTHLILIDDTDYKTDDGGKDKLLSPFLIEQDYCLLFNGRQTLFINRFPL
jgi:hypothetical protein